MKKLKLYSSIVSSFLAVTMPIISTVSVSADWKVDDNGKPYWIHENAPDELSISMLPEFAFTIYSKYNTLDLYKQYLEENNFNFNEEQVQMLFDDYKSRYIKFIDNDNNEVRYFPLMIVRVANDLKLSPNDFKGIFGFQHFENNYSAIEDIYNNYYLLAFFSFEDLNTARENLLQNSDVIDIIDFPLNRSLSDMFYYNAGDDIYGLPLVNTDILDTFQIDNVEVLNLSDTDDDINNLTSSNENLVITTSNNSIDNYSTADLIRLAKYISGKFSYEDATVKAAADFNADGALNSEDLLLMIKKLKGEI